MKIGFIGLGLMGHGCIRLLIARGHEVSGYDILSEKVDAAAAHGVRPAASPADAATNADCLMVSVTSTDAVASAVFGLGGIIETDGSGKVLIDLSTTEVPATHDFAERLGAGTEWAGSTRLCLAAPKRRPLAVWRSWLGDRTPI
ncbi:MAG: NAD(P)-binding domain-containing protein [Alphaproteobacteria bacterium]|nr:NAD(P)-binding domain-containing protein [Alphaproteobacteria bacterium]